MVYAKIGKIMCELPIYRAKVLKRDEYVQGFLCSEDVISYYDDGLYVTEIIDKTTLAIHLPNMIDNEHNQIFVSLQKNYKGADILEYKYKPFGANNFYYKHKILKYINGVLRVATIKDISGFEYTLGLETVYKDYKFTNFNLYEFKYVKVIGKL